MCARTVLLHFRKKRGVYAVVYMVAHLSHSKSILEFEFEFEIDCEFEFQFEMKVAIKAGCIFIFVLSYILL